MMENPRLRETTSTDDLQRHISHNSNFSIDQILYNKVSHTVWKSISKSLSFSTTNIEAKIFFVRKIPSQIDLGVRRLVWKVACHISIFLRSKQIFIHLSAKNRQIKRFIVSLTFDSLDTFPISLKFIIVAGNGRVGYIFCNNKLRCFCAFCAFCEYNQNKPTISYHQNAF